MTKYLTLAAILLVAGIHQASACQNTECELQELKDRVSDLEHKLNHSSGSSYVPPPGTSLDVYRWLMANMDKQDACLAGLGPEPELLQKMSCQGLSADPLAYLK